MSLVPINVVPILRILDVAKTREFYLDWLGFGVEFEHRFDENAPLYMGIARAGIVLHLSEHHGDGIPGTHVTVNLQSGLDELHAELIGKRYRYMRPGIETTFWGTRDMVVYDPFGNRLRFSERLPA
ncbi:MAG TPA: glyoxalase superfamily protein [Candidatus Elarobacter sp.]|jgi:uncharacterized glyoxalase superfamily protein PhnB|nr:glyoxalase superfamily protein [Candidatus Elarobacter sp.]